jgi:hypothetical protein
MGKTRPEDRPYLVVVNESAGWTWKVRKAYQAADKEVGNGFARWFCEVSSPMTGRYPDIGDVYVTEVLRPGNEVSWVSDDVADDVAIRLSRTDKGVDPIAALGF